MKHILQFFLKHRLLDGYIGILGVVLHYKILANYSGWFHLFSLSLRYIFSIDLSFHPRPSHYPPFHFSFSLFEKTIIDNGKKASQRNSDEVQAFIDRRKREKDAARKRLEQIDPEAARLI